MVYVTETLIVGSSSFQYTFFVLLYLKKKLNFTVRIWDEKRQHFLSENSSLLFIHVQETSFWTFAFCLMPSSVFLTLFRASAADNSLADRSKVLLILISLAGLFTPNKSMSKLSLHC